MTADRVFRRTRNIQHTTARSQRHQTQGDTPTWMRVVLQVSLIGCIGVLIGSAVAIFIPHRYLQLPSIRQFNCQMIDGSLCPEGIVDSLQPLTGTPLLFSALGEKLAPLVGPAGVQVVRYVRVLPDTLLITVAPLNMYFYLENQGKTTAVTRLGTKLTVPSTYNASLLVVHVDALPLSQELDADSQVPAWLVQLVTDLMNFFTATGTSPVNLTLRTPFELQLDLTGQSRPIVINPQESALNLARLSTILKSDQYTESATPGAKLDVRFRLPVLRR